MRTSLRGVRPRCYAFARLNVCDITNDMNIKMMKICTPCTRGAKGLVADFHVFDSSIGKFRPVRGKILEKDPEDGHFGYNACRCVIPS
jgi:hypothetical protein